MMSGDEVEEVVRGLSGTQRGVIAILADRRFYPRMLAATNQSSLIRLNTEGFGMSENATYEALLSALWGALEAQDAVVRNYDDYTHIDGHVEREQLAFNMLARLRTSGFVIVPSEPTIGMFRALVASWPEEARAGIWTLGSFREDYQAMLAASPHAQPNPEAPPHG